MPPLVRVVAAAGQDVGPPVVVHVHHRRLLDALVPATRIEVREDDAVLRGVDAMEVDGPSGLGLVEQDLRRIGGVAGPPVADRALEDVRLAVAVDVTAGGGEVVAVGERGGVADPDLPVAVDRLRAADLRRHGARAVRVPRVRRAVASEVLVVVVVDDRVAVEAARLEDALEGARAVV
ncbi:MAG TPA: hypothetical protein VF316_03040, partial [Polyangiaceae bacterium]